MGWVVIGGERGKVGHVGFGRGVTSFMGYKGHVTCQIQTMGEESVTSRVFEKTESLIFINEMRNCLDLRLQAGTWARTECHGGRPILS